MKKFLTSVIAIHNVQGQLGKWPGPIIEANSLEEADEWCKKNAGNNPMSERSELACRRLGICAIGVSFFTTVCLLS